MRAFALLSSGAVLLGAALQQTSLPAPLARHYTALAQAQSLTVIYSVRPIGEAPNAYKLVLSRPNEFRLTTPTGYIVSDGKTVTTYRTVGKAYSQVPFTEVWVTEFSHRPEILPWAPFFVKKAEEEVTAAKAGAARTIVGSETTEMQVSFKKMESPVTLFLDKKLSIARGGLIKVQNRELLVTATTLELGDKPLATEAFAFVAPEGATKEEPASAVASASFASVQGIMNLKCMPCHGGGNPRAGISLTNYTGVSAIVVPGRPAESLLIKSVRGVGARKMPPGNRMSLGEEEIKTLEAWIQAGAKSE